MSRTLAYLGAGLTIGVLCLVTAFVEGWLPRSSAALLSSRAYLGARPSTSPAGAMVDFADAVERINPTVVSIEAAARIVRDRHRQRRGFTPNEPDLFGDPLDFGSPRDSGSTRRGSGS